METYTARKERLREERAAAKRERCTAQNALLAEVESRAIPLHPKSSEEVRKNLRQELCAHRVELHDVLCDHCGTQLINPEPGSVLMSHPPQVHARCPGCGFCGYLEA